MNVTALETSEIGTNSSQRNPLSEHYLNTKLYVLGSITLVTLVGNVLIICLVKSHRESTMTRVYFFMFHLSIADVITAFLTLLPEFCWTLTLPYFYGGTVMCKIVKFLQLLGPYLRWEIFFRETYAHFICLCKLIQFCIFSSYTLTMMAIDRFQVKEFQFGHPVKYFMYLVLTFYNYFCFLKAICYPLSNQVWTSKRQHVMMTFAWIISISFCTPQVGNYSVTFLFSVLTFTINLVPSALDNVFFFFWYPIFTITIS